MTTQWLAVITMEKSSVVTTAYGPFYTYELAEDFAQKKIDELQKDWEPVDFRDIVLEYAIAVLEQPDLEDN